MTMAKLRREYHRRLFKDTVRLRSSPRYGRDCPNFSDVDSRSSVDIGVALVKILGHQVQSDVVTGQASGRTFEEITSEFLEGAFVLLRHLRPGKWEYSSKLPISCFDQYEHLATLETIIAEHKQLASALGTDYIVKPDIVVSRQPVSDEEVDEKGKVLNPAEEIATLTPLRRANRQAPRAILHASISCKWTLRSDRAQNARTEGLNLIRNRKGNLPHVVVVTAEPLPMRIASLALGTGDIDCVYHFALPELRLAVLETQNDDQLES